MEIFFGDVGLSGIGLHRIVAKCAQAYVELVLVICEKESRLIRYEFFCARVVDTSNCRSIPPFRFGKISVNCNWSSLVFRDKHLRTRRIVFALVY